MEKDIIKLLITDYQQYITQIDLIKRNICFMEGQNYVLIGLRHVGKSYLMYQRISELIGQGHQVEEILYFNFEDDRIGPMTSQDLDLIKICYEEMYDTKPIFFLDEIQIVEGWEKFARRLADWKYQVYITGSNAKMLSSEIATTLGGRYLIQEVFPYSLGEYLQANQIAWQSKTTRYQQRKAIVKTAERYFLQGGLPETATMRHTRPWMSSLFNKIFFGDLIARHTIRNDFGLRILVRKLAESVKQPLSYNRMASIVSATGKKLSVDTTIDYIQFMIDAWLLIPYENFVGKMQDKEMNRKYYFTDNGILALFLIDPVTSLLENLVAIQLRRYYGERVYFYLTPKSEVDFFVPEEGIAIQVAYSLTDEATRTREIAALLALSEYQPVSRRLIITKEQSEQITMEDQLIEVIPYWEWLLDVSSPM